MSELRHEDIRWRVSNTWDKGGTKMGMLVGYIDSRTAMEALDALDANWSSKMEPITLGGEHGIRCTLVVNGIAREDVGVVSNTEPLKGAFSDALKRAAVHFGIGRELYELPKIAVECEVNSNTGKVKGPKALPVFRNGRWEIDRALGWVRYEREPEDQPERGSGQSNRGSSSRPSRSGGATADQSAVTPAPAQSRREELATLAHEKGLDRKGLERYAAIVGIPEGTRATNEQMDALIDSVRGHGDDQPIESAAPPPAAEESSGPEGAPSGPPPKPGNDEYAALPAPQKAAARAHWAKQPEQASLAEQLGAPAA